MHANTLASRSALCEAAPPLVRAHPSCTAFICYQLVCPSPIPVTYFCSWSPYQELAKYEIDTHNIIINQIIYPDIGKPGAMHSMAARV